MRLVLHVTENRLHKTKGTKNDNNTNAKQNQKYNTSQAIEDNEYRYMQYYFGIIFLGRNE